MKRCARCREQKPLGEFHRNRATRDGRHPYCRPCKSASAKASYRKNPRPAKESAKMWRAKNPESVEQIVHRQNLKKYGMTPADYESLLAAQGGRCGICGVTPDVAPRNKLFVDHCHASSKVRGLLCSRCNTGLGFLRDDTTTLRAAIAYLEAA